MRHSHTLPAVLTLLLAAAPAIAQQPAPLTVGRTIERSIALGQTHSYPLTIESGRFAAGEVMQIGIDLQVAIVGPAGDTIRKFDSPNGNNGAEPFSFTTKTRAFHREPDGTVKRLTLNQNGLHPATRVGAGAVAAKPDFAQFAGRYFSEELEAFYEIEASGDSLVLRSRRLPPIPLNHVRGDVFAGGFPVTSITFERDAAGKVTGLKAGNSRTRDVVFRKQD